MNYIVHKRFKQKALCGDVNLPATTECDLVGGVIFANGNYIKYNDCGSFCPAREEEAIGIAVYGTPYNLIGHSEIEGADTVIVSSVDISVFARMAMQNAANLDYFSAMTDIELPNEDEGEAAPQDYGDEPNGDYIEEDYDDTVDDTEYTDSDDEEDSEE